MSQADDTVVRRQVVVDAPIDRAFKVFVEQFGDFKPKEHNLLGAELVETEFEPRVGGHIVDRAEDSSECRWARVLAYEPPTRVVFSWDISPCWQLEADAANASEVEVRFVAETPTARVSNSCTGSWIATAPAGRVCATASARRAVGPCISLGTPGWRRRHRSASAPGSTTDLGVTAGAWTTA
jgi:hypothetical protein